MATISIDKMRIGGSKVRTGCRTCKTRRVKCDEAKPSCQRCLKAERRCEGYAASPEPVKALTGHKFVHYVNPERSSLSRSPSPETELDLHALRSLDFFRHITAIQLEQPFSGDSWLQTLLRLMHNEPAVKHGVISLAALHENYLFPSKSSNEDQRKVVAFEHYGKSIRNVVALNRKDLAGATMTTLVTCLLYCGIESMQGHFSSAIKHIAAGIRLLDQYEEVLLEQEDAGCGGSSGFVDGLRRMFVNLCTQARNMVEDGIDVAALRYLEKTSKVLTSHSFGSTEQAMTELSFFMSDVVQFLTWGEQINKESDFPNTAYQLAEQNLQERYGSWASRYNEILTASIDSIPDHSALLILRLNQIILRIMLKVALATGQTVFDEHLDDFKMIVSTAEDLLQVEARQRQGTIEQSSSVSPHRSSSPPPIFTMSMGIVPGLFFVCSRCRHRETRHRALDILQNNQRREAIWDSKVVSIVAQQMIELEEQNAHQHWQEYGVDVSSASSLPETARVHTIEVVFQAIETTAQISFLERREPSYKHERMIAWDG